MATLGILVTKGFSPKVLSSNVSPTSSGSRIKIPGGREARHQNAHKAQLALKRRIQELEGHLVTAKRRESKAIDRLVQLENRLLSIETDRTSLRARLDSLEDGIAEIERVLGLRKDRLSGKERAEQLLAAVRALPNKRNALEPADLGAPLFA